MEQVKYTLPHQIMHGNFVFFSFGTCANVCFPHTTPNNFFKKSIRYERMEQAVVTVPTGNMANTQNFLFSPLQKSWQKLLESLLQ